MNFCTRTNGVELCYWMSQNRLNVHWCRIALLWVYFVIYKIIYINFTRVSLHSLEVNFYTNEKYDEFTHVSNELSTNAYPIEFYAFPHSLHENLWHALSSNHWSVPYQHRYIFRYPVRYSYTHIYTNVCPCVRHSFIRLFRAFCYEHNKNAFWDWTLSVCLSVC